MFIFIQKIEDSLKKLKRRNFFIYIPVIVYKNYYVQARFGDGGMDWGIG